MPTPCSAIQINDLTKRLDNTVKTSLDPALKAMPDALTRVKTAATDVSRVANNLNSTVSRVNEKDGALDRLASGTQALGQAVDSFNTATLPRVNRVADDTSRAVRRLGRAADGINDNPQSLLFGNGGATAGPGEAGFAVPPASALPAANSAARP